MVRPQCPEHLIGRDRAGRIHLHRIVNRRDLLAKPAIDGRVALLQRPQSGPHDFTGGAIHAASHLRVDVAGLLGGQADGALLHMSHDILQALSSAI